MSTVLSALTGFESGVPCRFPLLPGQLQQRPTKRPWMQYNCLWTAWACSTLTSCCCMQQEEQRDVQRPGGPWRQQKKRCAIIRIDK
jgi:hypothetical protein